MAVIQPLSAPVPPDATDFAIAVPAGQIAWLHNRVITLHNGDCVAIPPGWEALYNGDGLVIIYYDHENNSNEELNA